MNPDAQSEDQDEAERPSLGNQSAAAVSNPTEIHFKNVPIDGTASAIRTNYDDEAGPLHRLVLQNSRNNVSLIKLPQKITSKGRLKGKVNTVIGLKRKAIRESEASHQKKKVFGTCL